MGITPSVIDTIKGWNDIDQQGANLTNTNLRNDALRNQNDISARSSALLRASVVGDPNKMTQLQDGTVVPDVPGTTFTQDIKAAQQQVDQLTQQVDVYARAGNVAAHDKAQDDLIKARTELRMIKQDGLKEFQSRSQQAAETLGGVRNADDLQAALNWVAQSIGPKQAKEIADQVAKTIPDLKAATPDQIMAALAPITNKYVSTGDQLRKKEADERAKLEKQRIDDARDKEKRVAADADREAQRKRDALEFNKTKEEHKQDAAKAKEQRVANAASKPATATMISQARASVKASIDIPMDSGSLDAFAGDVADRANKIRAESVKSGEDMSLDEARNQAIAELKPFVRETKEGGFNVLGHDIIEGKSVGKYHRPGMPGGSGTWEGGDKPAGKPAAEKPDDKKGEASTTPPATIQRAFNGNPNMKGMTLGKMTAKGAEVVDSKGKVVGYYTED